MKCFGMLKKWIIVLLFLVPVLVLAQPTKQKGLGEVSEIIIPATAKMQNNNNLYYEVHLSRNDYPSPSFWYKIIFKEDCFFEFTLMPLNEEDGYDFYFFKVLGNVDFCRSVKEEKLVSCNAARIYKQYNDKEQTDEFRSKLVNIKAIPVKAGDAIYIEVFSTLGFDCGHVLDFRTTTSSFVVKVVNDKCAELRNGDASVLETKYKPVFTEKEAIRIFSNTVCNLNFNTPVMVSAIQSGDQGVNVQKKLDFNAYSASEAHKYTKYQPKDTVVKTPEKPAVNGLGNAAVTSTTAVVAPSVPEQQNHVKSTADLTPVTEANPIKGEIKTITEADDKMSTRLEVDLALFQLLDEDLKRKMDWNRQQLKEYNWALKSTHAKSEKQEVQASIKDTKEQNKQLLLQSKETKIKIKKIRKLLADRKKNNTNMGESVFAKSGYTEEVLKSKNTATAEAPKPDGTILYKVQIGVYRNPISADVFKGISPLFCEIFPGGVKYYAGAFTKYKDAQNAKEYIKAMGLKDAFVVAFFNGKRISVDDARKYEGGQ